MNENVGIDAINFSLPRLTLPIEDLHQRKLESPISKTSGFSLKKKLAKRIWRLDIVFMI